MDARSKALLWIGFQHDYFAADGVLRSVVEEPARISHTPENPPFAVDYLVAMDTLMMTTPTLFTSDYEEMVEPVGSPKTIGECGASERGFRVSMLSDCISSRTLLEQDFDLSQLYPLYSRVPTRREFVSAVSAER